AVCPPSALARPDLHSFPTRRSSDLAAQFEMERPGIDARPAGHPADGTHPRDPLQILDTEPDMLPLLVDGHRLVVEPAIAVADDRSEEHTSELQSRFDLVCRLLLEKK